ncbi:hypothetical protein JMJ77_0014660, partial [Colletotrichum scovillei]
MERGNLTTEGKIEAASTQ